MNRRHATMLMSIAAVALGSVTTINTSSPDLAAGLPLGGAPAPRSFYANNGAAMVGRRPRAGRPGSIRKGKRVKGGR